MEAFAGFMVGFYVEKSSDAQEIKKKLLVVAVAVSLSSRSYRGRTVKQKSAAADTKSNSKSKRHHSIPDTLLD